MKIAYGILCVIFCAALLTHCKTRQKIEYNIPKEIPEATRAIFLERCEKGKILFKINCSGCHGIFTKGKDGVTNFTKDQIDSYRAVAQIGNDKKNHAVAAKMSAQQLDYILTFLSLRKDK
jgi:mono/diheme cytochrome c family protein